MRFNGTPKQNAWAAKIVANANLTDAQIEALLWYAGPTMQSQGICDVRIVIENRERLAAYADSLIRMRSMTPDERHALAEEACNAVADVARKRVQGA